VLTGAVWVLSSPRGGRNRIPGGSGGNGGILRSETCRFEIFARGGQPGGECLRCLRCPGNATTIVPAAKRRSAPRVAGRTGTTSDHLPFETKRPGDDHPGPA